MISRYSIWGYTGASQLFIVLSGNQSSYDDFFLKVNGVLSMKPECTLLCPFL